MSNCCSCKKYMKVSVNPWICEICEGEHHPECSGQYSDGTGEYPDEDAYSICKRCLGKVNSVKLDSHGNPIKDAEDKENVQK